MSIIDSVRNKTQGTQKGADMKRKLNTNELREIAVSLGADKKKLYGTSRTALVVIIDNLKKGAKA